jgi:type IV pilus assembly protein PilA
VNASTAARASSSDGFTLIELTVVVLIIGILVAIAVPKFLNSQHGAQARTAQENVRSAETIMSAAYAEKSSYEPIDLALLTRNDSTLYPPSDTVGQPSNYAGQISWTYVTGGAPTLSPIGAQGFVVAARSRDNRCYFIKVDGPDRRFGQKVVPGTGDCVASATPDVNATTGVAWSDNVDAQWS